MAAWNPSQILLSKLQDQGFLLIFLPVSLTTMYMGHAQDLGGRFDGISHISSPSRDLCKLSKEQNFGVSYGLSRISLVCITDGDLFALPCRPKLFRTISGFFGISQQIQIRFSSSRTFFLMIRIFVCVQCSTTCNETVHVHVLWPVCILHNSIPNVVVPVTIHDIIYISIFMYM